MVLVADTTPATACRGPVREPMVAVPVAVRFPPMYVLPTTESAARGEVVPIPTLPLSSTVNTFVPPVSKRLKMSEVPVERTERRAVVSVTDPTLTTPPLPCNTSGRLSQLVAGCMDWIKLMSFVASVPKCSATSPADSVVMMRMPTLPSLLYAPSFMTVSFAVGLVPPTPTFPPVVARYVEPVVVSWVVEAPALNC